MPFPAGKIDAYPWKQGEDAAPEEMWPRNYCVSALRTRLCSLKVIWLPAGHFSLLPLLSHLPSHLKGSFPSLHLLIQRISLFFNALVGDQLEEVIFSTSDNTQLYKLMTDRC